MAGYEVTNRFYEIGTPPPSKKPALIFNPRRDERESSVKGGS